MIAEKRLRNLHDRVRRSSPLENERTAAHEAFAAEAVRAIIPALDEIQRLREEASRMVDLWQVDADRANRAEREREALTTALILLRDRLPQLTLDDFCDWQRAIIDGALAATPAEALARREREQAIIHAATEYRQANAILDSEPEPHPDPLARTVLIEIGEQKRERLFGAVDGLKEGTP